MSHVAPPIVVSNRRRRLRQTGASVLLALGLVVTVFSAPSLAEDAVQGDGEGVAAPSLSVAQCRERATDAEPVADGCGSYRELLLREAAQRTEASQRAAEVQAAAEREAEAQRQAAEEEQAQREAEAARAANEAQDGPIDELTDILPELPESSAPSTPVSSTPSTPEVSTPSTPEVSTPSTPEVSTPSTPEVSTPSTPGNGNGNGGNGNGNGGNGGNGGTGNGSANGSVGSSGGSPEGVLPGVQAAAPELGSCGSSVVCGSTPTAPSSSTARATGLPDTGAPASGGLVGLGLAMVLGGLVLLRPRRGRGRHVLAL